MLTYAEIRDILLSLESHYQGRDPKFSKDFVNDAKWVLRDVNKEAIKKIKQKYGRGQS